MARSSLGQAFVRSMVRQIGRDAGKVVSNKAFGDAHATPVRMVGSADTSQQYSGTRRRFRHDLDRVVNGDLPSTTGSAKKSLVKLENALEDFLNDLMPMGGADDVQIVRNWIDKSLDFIGDVLKIVDKPEVKALADGLVESIDGIKEQVKEQVGQYEVPVHQDFSGKMRTARWVFWSGICALIIGSWMFDPNPPIASKPAAEKEVLQGQEVVNGAETSSPENGSLNVLDASILIAGSGFWMMIFGGVMLSRSKSRRSSHDYLVANAESMKEAVHHW